MKKASLVFILKILILAGLTIFSIANLKITLDQTLTENESLVFIKDIPEENYILKTFAYISGEVNKPGVYELPNDHTTILELIDLAGGLTSNTDHNYISKTLNLAEIVKDSDHIFIPSNTTFASNKGTNTMLAKIDINSASESQLDSLPGIGPSTAQKIIQARPFTNIEDIKNVSGIGDSKFNQIKDLITVQ